MGVGLSLPLGWDHGQQWESVCTLSRNMCTLVWWAQARSCSPGLPCSTSLLTKELCGPGLW